MNQQIINELNQLEKDLSIKILYAVESGSRAWGFASTDSDWDVRFIYVHHPDWYLSIDEKKDNYERILENNIDLGGWELRKALRLFRKSNPPLMEWLRSPLIYSENYSTAKQLRELSSGFFNEISCLHHYLHMAEGNYRVYLQGDQVRLKKYFYVLRPILACQWIEQRKSMPPMEFRTLLDTLVQDALLKNEIEKLLQRKMSGEELKEENKIEAIHKFLSDQIPYYLEYVKQKPAKQSHDTNKLNELFRKTLYEAW